MHSAVKVSGPVEDFQLSSFFNNCVQPLIGNAAELEVWVMHSAPANLDEHRLTFSGATLRFDAPWSGYRFASQRLDQPIATADASLNQILRSHLDRSLEETPATHSVVARAQHLIRRELPRGQANAPQIARALGMSRRTLCRRLEEEQTTFSTVLDDVRRTLAVEQVRLGQLALSEIAFVLGFAQAAGFHRAFKRWTGQTPKEYRERPR
jgi:AraC-like DNA-binding protein